MSFPKFPDWDFGKSLTRHRHRSENFHRQAISQCFTMAYGREDRSSNDYACFPRARTVHNVS